jgi:hypothetical protein
METTVNGYGRIRQLNRFLPTDVQVALFKNIGRNERVHVADFILGDDYTKTETPYLPNGLAKEIREHDHMSIEKWCAKVHNLLNDTNYIEDKDKDYRAVHTGAEYLFRFITNYPIQTENERFVGTVLKKCYDILDDFRRMDEKADEQYDNYVHAYQTRENVSRIKDLNDREIARHKVRQEIFKCIEVYNDLDIKFQLARCARYMESVQGGEVAVAMAMPSTPSS